jgi:hypothetical protein
LYYGRITWVLKKVGFCSIFENSIASRNTMKEYRKTLEQEQQGILTKKQEEQHGTKVIN